MNVVALIGESGSGKSYKAIMLAKELDIEYIIDDGLLIKGNKIIAGSSAKRENTTISAVKRAIFMDYGHRSDVKKAIVDSDIEDILIIGTSENMIWKIVSSLELDRVYKRIYIEEISSKEDIDMAKKERRIEGKHIIPVPTFEVRKDFSGYFMDSLKIFKKKNTSQKESYEKTIMRPTFSYLGKYKISNDVIKDIIRHNIGEVEEVIRISKIYIETDEMGICINIDLYMLYGCDIIRVTRNMQEQIKTEIEHMTSLNILGIDISIKGLKFRK